MNDNDCDGDTGNPSGRAPIGAPCPFDQGDRYQGVGDERCANCAHEQQCSRYEEALRAERKRARAAERELLTAQGTVNEAACAAGDLRAKIADLEDDGAKLLARCTTAEGELDGWRQQLTSAKADRDAYSDDLARLRTEADFRCKGYDARRTGVTRAACAIEDHNLAHCWLLGWDRADNAEQVGVLTAKLATSERERQTVAQECERLWARCATTDCGDCSEQKPPDDSPTVAHLRAELNAANRRIEALLRALERAE